MIKYKKSITLIIFFVLILNASSLLVFGDETDVEEDKTEIELEFEDLLWEYKREYPSQTLLYKLEDLQEDVFNSSLPSVKKENLIRKIKELIDETIDIIIRNNLNTTEREIKQNIKIGNIKNSIYIILPLLEKDFEYFYSLYDKIDNKLLIRDFTDELIDISRYIKNIPLILKVEVIDNYNRNTIISFDININADDIKSPTITYTYVMDGTLYLKFEDEFGEIEGIIEYDKEGEGTKIVNNNSIKVDIPSKVTIITKDVFDNETERIFEIEEDNVILTGVPPRDIIELLKKKKTSKISRYNGIKNLFVVEYGKRGKLLDELKYEVFEKFGAYNKGDIFLTSQDLSIDDDGFVNFNKEGIFKVQVNHFFYTEDSFDVYVIIKRDAIYYTNIEEIKVRNPCMVYEEKVNFLNFLDIKQTIKGYNPNLSFIFVKDIEENEVFSITKNINLEKNEIKSFEILDLLDEKEYYLDLKLIDRPELLITSFYDLDYKHWAYNDIKEATLKKLINGYPDKTFKPDNNITVKEFMSLLARFLANQSLYNIQETKNNIIPFLDKGDWAYIETKSVINRIDLKSLDYFDIQNFNREITREEVALLISNNMNIEKEVKDKAIFEDTLTSPYLEHINKLVQMEIILGYPDGTFKPNNRITRAEVTAMLNRLDF